MSGTPAVSPDGKNLAFIGETGGARQIWVRALDSITARQCAGTELAEGLFWAPDSRRLGFLTGTHLKTIDLATEAVKQVCGFGSSARGASRD